MKLATTLLVLLTTIPTALSVPVALDQVQPDSVSDFPATVYSSTDIPSSFPTDSVLDNDDGLDFIQATNENLASSYISPEDYHRIIAAMNNTETDGEDMFSAQGFNNPLYREYDGSLFQVFRHNDGNSENDEVCNTMSAPYMPYTGFRFITTAKVSVLFFRKKTSSLVYCYQGKEIARASKKPSLETVTLFGVLLTVSSTKTLSKDLSGVGHLSKVVMFLLVWLLHSTLKLLWESVGEDPSAFMVVYSDTQEMDITSCLTRLLFPLHL